MWLDLDGLRVVHACWDEQAINQIAQALEEQRGVTPAFLQSACKKGNPLFAAIEVALKGKEAALPDRRSFLDPDGSEAPRNPHPLVFGPHKDRHLRPAILSSRPQFNAT